MGSTLHRVFSYSMLLNCFSGALPGEVTISGGYWGILSLLRGDLITKFQPFRVLQLIHNSMQKGHKESTYLLEWFWSNKIKTNLLLTNIVELNLGGRLEDNIKHYIKKNSHKVMNLPSHCLRIQYKMIQIINW